VLFNLVTSAWYLVFWHVIVDNSKLLVNGQYLYDGSVLNAWWHGYAGITYTNLYWNLLWLGFSIFIALVSGFLFWVDRSRRDAREAAMVLEGAPG
jgi:hypothetical protein